nr:site-specific integrase [Methylobacterium sp.]
MLTDIQVARLVQDFYSTVLERENEVRLRLPPLDDEMAENRGAYYAEVAATARKALAANRLRESMFVTEIMLKKQGIDCASLTVEDWQHARQAVLRAGVDIAEALQARYAGDFNYEPRDKLLRQVLDPAPLAQAPGPTPSPTPVAVEVATGSEKSSKEKTPPLSTLVEPFLTSQIAGGAWERQSAAQARATFRLFIDVCGDRSLDEYSRKEAGLFKEKIQLLPSDYGKAAIYRGMRVDQIIECYSQKPASECEKPITAKTIKRHFSALSTFWVTAQAKGEVSDNIFLGFRFGAGKRAEEQRDQWELDELSKFFRSPIWSGCASEMQRTEPGPNIIRDEKFWLPLIAVFSGMRQEEICQLSLDNIKLQEGIWFFELNRSEGRMLKNTTAIRRVPVHDEIIRIGLLKRVAVLRKQGEKRLFPELKPGGADGRLGHAFAKWFTRYRREVGLDREKLVFHSYRHTSTALMLEADVQALIVDRVTGHTTVGETARYTKRISLRQLHAAVNKINIEVNLSHLYEK